MIIKRLIHTHIHSKFYFLMNPTMITGIDIVISILKYMIDNFEFFRLIFRLNAERRYYKVL